MKINEAVMKGTDFLDAGILKKFKPGRQSKNDLFKDAERLNALVHTLENVEDVTDKDGNVHKFVLTAYTYNGKQYTFDGKIPSDSYKEFLLKYENAIRDSAVAYKTDVVDDKTVKFGKYSLLGKGKDNNSTFGFMDGTKITPAALEDLDAKSFFASKQANAKGKSGKYKVSGVSQSDTDLFTAIYVEGMLEQHEYTKDANTNLTKQELIDYGTNVLSNKFSHGLEKELEIKKLLDINNDESWVNSAKGTANALQHTLSNSNAYKVEVFGYGPISSMLTLFFNKHVKNSGVVTEDGIRYNLDDGTSPGDEIRTLSQQDKWTVCDAILYNENKIDAIVKQLKVFANTAPITDGVPTILLMNNYILAMLKSKDIVPVSFKKAGFAQVIAYKNIHKYDINNGFFRNVDDSERKADEVFHEKDIAIAFSAKITTQLDAYKHEAFDTKNLIVGDGHAYINFRNKSGKGPDQFTCEVQSKINKEARYGSVNLKVALEIIAKFMHERIVIGTFKIADGVPDKESVYYKSVANAYSRITGKQDFDSKVLSVLEEKGDAYLFDACTCILLADAFAKHYNTPEFFKSLNQIYELATTTHRLAAPFAINGNDHT